MHGHATEYFDSPCLPLIRHHALSYEAVCREPLSTFTMAQPGMRRTSSAQGLSPITDTPTIAASAFKSGSEHQFHTSPTLPAGVDVEATTAAVAAADEARADSIINGNCGDPSMGGLDVLPDPADIFQPVEGSALSESLSQSHPLECILTDHTEAAAAECGTHFDAAPTGVQEAPAYLTSSNSVSDDTGMPHCNGDVTQLEDELAAAEWELVGQSLEGEQVEVIDSEEYVLL